MKTLRNLITATITVLFLGVSIAPAAAATPQYANQYSWSGQTGYNYTTTTATKNYSNSYSPYYSYYNYYQTQPTQVPTKPSTTTTTKPTTTTTKPASTASITTQEHQMVNLVNQERSSRGLKALQVDTKLVKVARMKSQDMINNKYFGHQSPKYGSPFDLMKSQGVTYRYAGENLAGADTVQRAHTNLMNSEGHRKNILNSNYTKIGIGVVKGGPYGLMISQEFTG
jgi:uncharacterized YkwD family protein